MEPHEIHEFSEQMKEAGEKALTHISLAISILAVLVAMVTVLGHRTHTEAMLTQTRAADQWNQYQAKKIRQTQVTVAADLLSLQPSADNAGVKQKLNEYNSHLAKWSDELNEEQKKAIELEDEVDKAERKAARYDLGEALLQIAVVLSSVTLLTRKNGFFFFALLLGLVGLIWSASALLL